MKIKRRPNIIASEKTIERCMAAAMKPAKYVRWALRTQCATLPVVARQIREFAIYEGAVYEDINNLKKKTLFND